MASRMVQNMSDEEYFDNLNYILEEFVTGESTKEYLSLLDGLEQVAMIIIKHSELLNENTYTFNEYISIDDSTLLVEVRGYCDYMGKDNYNKKLSIRRAERVKQELVKVWKIDPRRINSNGNGRIITPPIKYRPNRRCDFYFSK